MNRIHFHRFTVLADSRIKHEGELRWIERCKCGYSVNCEVDLMKRKTRKQWFDSEGNLTRGTWKCYTSEEIAFATRKANAQSSEPQPKVTDIDTETGKTSTQTHANEPTDLK